MGKKFGNNVLRIVLACLALILLVAPVMAATTQVHVVKYANDKITILNETTKTYEWLEANLPVLGDGTTHYYSQGPTFNETDPYDDAEWQNIDTADWGAVKGTDVKDICNLVGGMSTGETVKIKATDGFSKTFPYEYIYSPNPRQGPMGITWYRADQGYASTYTDGMRLVMFADAKINTYGWNTSGWHVFGNADMRDSWAPIDRYNFSGIWPSSKGVSVKNVSDIIINSNLPPPPVPLFTANVTSGVAPLVVKFTDQSTGIIISWAWDFNGDGIIDSTLQNPEITFLDPGTYPVNLTVTNAGGSKSLEKFSYIAVSSVPVDDWSITLNGAGSEVLTRTNFETLAEGNRLTYNDGSSTWSGVALWRILARVDDSNPATFNDAVADLGYMVNVSASDGFSAKFTSATLKRNDNWIVADTVNGTALPKLDGKGKMFWPLKLVGSETTSGSQRIANITSITLENLPSVPTAAFTSDVQNGNAPLTVKFTDQSTGTGPLTYAWDFNNDGSVDNTTQSPSYIYINPGTYSVNLTVTNGIGSDTELKTSYITVTAVPVVNDWSITLNGAGSEVLTRTNFETLAEGNRLTYNDGSSTWSGVALWRILARVDDSNPATFNDAVADLGYTVNVSASDGFSAKFTSATLKRNDNWIVADTVNGTALPKLDGKGKMFWPLKLVGSETTSGSQRIANITSITLENLPSVPTAAFTSDVQSGNAPLTVKFTDASTGTGPLTYAWDFNNDGSVDNTTQSPSYIYINPGTYSVNLTVTNGIGSDTELKTSYITVTAVPVVDTIFDGTVTLTSGETFTKQAYNNVTGGLYTINRTTPLGALDKVALQQGFTYNVTDKRWQYDQTLLLDDVSHYLRKSPGYWYPYVNGVYKDGYGNHANGLNVIELANNDQVNFYYSTGDSVTAPTDALAAVKINVKIGDQPTVPDWTLSLTGAKNTSVTKTFFEQGLACPASGHQKFWTDANGDVWGGVPLWVLVSMVDDNPDVGPDHFNFNDSIAAQGYSVKVTSGDGWDTTLSSQNIARNNSIIVANTLNGQPLPLLTSAGKRSWPLHLKGESVFGGQQVGNITKIELTGLPKPPSEWTLTLEGDVTDTITQSFFIDAIACKHNVTWTDSSGTVWQGVPLWDLAGAVDDIESSNHYTFNDTRATMGYTIRVSAADGFNATFASVTAAHNDGFFVAYKMNGTPLTGTNAPLKLVGPATTSNKQRVGGIVKISLEGLPDQYPQGDWQLKLVGKISDIIPQGEFEYSAGCHNATYTDANGNVYTGIPLWRLMGWVDDRIPHGPDGFNDAAAIAGYKVIVKAGDGYAKEFTSQQIGKTNAFIIANTYNGGPIPNNGDHPPYPLRLVGSGATGGNSVGNVVEIQLTDFQTPTDVPKLHVIKYGSDGVTVINETYVDYTYMESNLPVIGDGITAYKFEGLTLNPSNLWDPEETYPGGFKISNVVKGSRVRDLAELVGGMGSGTTITFVASDNFETTLPYSSIYTNPAVQARQGDAIIAWWSDGQYVPGYADGMRLFFTPDGDHVYGQWDMHETLPSQYWRYNFQDGVQYPSAAGLSAKYITTIKVYSSPESDWTLELDGRDIGGVNYTVAKPFLEEAIACQFGADHKATYTDNKGRVWEGMPLWFFAGFVDDADQHSRNAFNETKALAGYNVIVTGTDDYTTTISSRDIIRSSNYLVANSLNGTHIADSDENWPLRFTGANVSGSMTVKGVKSIKLVPVPEIPVAAFSAVPLSGFAPLEVQFTDQSTGTKPLTYAWDFNNDGLTDNTTQSPLYTYATAGTYTVNLTVTGPGGSDYELKTGYILVTSPTGSIDVISTPPGAKIFIDAVDTGEVTPFIFDKVPGNYNVYVTLNGYQTPVAKSVSVVAGQTSSTNFILDPVIIRTGSIMVTSARSGASIYLDGKDTGLFTPGTLTNIPVGNHLVYVTLTGHKIPETKTIIVERGDKVNVHFILKSETPNSGSIKVTSAPAGAAIFLDGIDTGKVTPDTLTDVPAGKHVVYVTISKYSTPDAATVEVIGGVKANVHFILKSKPNIMLK